MKNESQELLGKEIDLFDQRLANIDQIQSNTIRVTRICGLASVLVFGSSILAIKGDQLVVAGISIVAFVLCLLIGAIIGGLMHHRWKQEDGKLAKGCDQLIAEIEAIQATRPVKPLTVSVRLQLHPTKNRKKQKKGLVPQLRPWYPLEYIQYLESRWGE